MKIIEKIWRDWHRPLTVTTALMVALMVVSAIGLVVDDRTLLGESVWVKPLKFGFAFAIYAATFGWLLSKIHKAKRFGWWMGTLFAVVGPVEVGAITFQAARGTFSHFNANLADPVNQVITPILTYGVAVLLVALLTMAVTVLVQRAGDRALTRAIRAGLGLTIVGVAVPIWWLVTNIEKRTVADANGTRVLMYQGHGRGDLDGHGMPLTNWSVTGGDMRVPHFLALHGIQVLLLLAAVLALLGARHAWLRAEKVRARLVGAAALGYTGLVGVTIWQAWRGQSLIHPDAQTLTAFAAVSLVTALLALMASGVGGRRPR